MNEQDTARTPVDCPYCGRNFMVDATALERHSVVCPFCDEQINIEVESDEATAHWQSPDPLVPEVIPPWPRPKKPRRGLKNFCAVLIGMLGGFLLRLVIGIPLVLVFAGEEGLPHDLSLLLDLFTAFIAGALAASLVPRLGWLYGMLTQIFKLIATAIFLGAWAYLLATDPDFEFSIVTPLKAFEMRTMYFSIICATIAGAIAERYRENILSFLGSAFGMLTGSIGCLLHFFFIIFELYFLYLGGKAIFADGEILMGLAIVFFFGPIASGLIGLIFFGIAATIAWIFSKIHNWYAEDLGLEPI